MRKNTGSDPDDNDKKEVDPSEAADTHNPPSDRALAPMRDAQGNAARTGFLFGQIIRGIASGIARGIVDDFLDGN